MSHSLDAAVVMLTIDCGHSKHLLRMVRPPKLCVACIWSNHCCHVSALMCHQQSPSRHELSSLSAFTKSTLSESTHSD
jgi:hypothetical protein